MIPSIHSGMDTLNNAIESLMTSSSQEDWPSVNMSVADATVTVISEKVGKVAHVLGLSRLHWGFGHKSLPSNLGT